MKQKWTVLQEKVEKLFKDCENFGRPKPALTYYDKMRDELEEQN